MQDFRNLDAWKKAHALVLRVYEESTRMPDGEAFGITHQLRRSAVGIPTRLAEGCGKKTTAEYAVDLRRAVAGCNELEYLVLLSGDLKFWKLDRSDELFAMTVEVRKMIYGVLRGLSQ